MIQVSTLKDRFFKEANNRLQNYEKQLDIIKKSNIENKEQKIKELELAIHKQKQIISNINSYK